MKKRKLFVVFLIIIFYIIARNHFLILSQEDDWEDFDYSDSPDVSSSPDVGNSSDVGNSPDVGNSSDVDSSPDVDNSEWEDSVLENNNKDVQSEDWSESGYDFTKEFYIAVVLGIIAFGILIVWIIFLFKKPHTFKENKVKGGFLKK